MNQHHYASQSHRQKRDIDLKSEKTAILHKKKNLNSNILDGILIKMNKYNIMLNNNTLFKNELNLYHKIQRTVFK